MSNLFGVLAEKKPLQYLLKPLTSVRYLGGVAFASLLLAGCSNAPVAQWPWVLSPSVVPSGQPVPTQPPTYPSYPPQTGGNPSFPPRMNPQINYPPPAQGRGDYMTYPAMRSFISKMNRVHGFNLAFLEQTFAGVQRDSEVLVKAGAPAEGQPWRAYRPIFLTEERIRGGVDFWHRNQAILDNTARQYGVDPEYMVAIIGVETQYGKNTGKHNVLRALTTLGFDYSRRSDFYQRELEQFLLLAREEGVQPQIFTGSYAGAMGLGQFIPSSYRSYALDGNRDRKRDLWNPLDAIPSVANYFARNGWVRGGGVAVPAYVSGSSYARLAETSAKKPSRSMAELLSNGVRPQVALNSARVSLLKLEGTGSDEYWVGGDNFYVITRYNPNVKYAMAVHQLAQAIRQRKLGY